MSTTTNEWNAALYNAKHAFVYAYGNSLVELLNPEINERILDLGCGSGQLTAAIGEKCAEIVGMDASETMIKSAKELYPDIDFLVCDAANFEVEKPFDAVFSNATLHWVKDYKNAVKCIYNVLKPGGRLVVEFGGKGNVKTIVDALVETLNNFGFKDAETKNPWYFPSIAAYTSVLEEIGFDVEVGHLYKRPTLLADKATGIIDWLTMFANSFFVDVPVEIQEKVKYQVQEKVKPVLFINDDWYADYKRLRIVAFKNQQ